MDKSSTGVCTLAIYRGVSPAYPFVIAANRDELYARPSAAPALCRDPPGVVAGRDLQAGGTWLGCRTTPNVLAAGLLNRRSHDGAVPSARGARSRGLLCLDVLRGADVGSVMADLDADAIAGYGPFNLLIADLGRAVVVDNADGFRVTELDQGLSVLTNLDVNDPRCPRLANATAGFEEVCNCLAAARPVSSLVAELRAVLGDHDNRLDPADDSPLSRLCVHTDAYGTRSSSIVIVERGGVVQYFHAEGPPCSTEFRRVAVEAQPPAS